mmetsp:Transcript_24441/g.47517  ORF Transcript_24441/g.47517 Transcript_24441/m.47517 type:complete len:256 (+) Transcript_24441:165-932(+)
MLTAKKQMRCLLVLALGLAIGVCGVDSESVIPPAGGVPLQRSGEEGWDTAAVSEFARVYSGLFHNQEEHEAAPSEVPFASKYHVPISIDWLCPPAGPVACFYVHEKTNRAGRMQYRLRISAVSHGKGEAGQEVFTADNYQFADQKSLEALPEEECAKIASAVNSTQISRVPGGTVDFRRVAGTSIFEVETNYAACDSDKKDASAPHVETHISGVLSESGWSVDAVGKRASDGKEVFRTHVKLKRVDSVETPPTIE